MPMFKKLILLGRPASGKSEFIDFLKNTPEKERAQNYHIGPFKELDDFLWLWEKFKEDDLWETAGHPRRYSKTAEHGYVEIDKCPSCQVVVLDAGELEKIVEEEASVLKSFVDFFRK